MGLLRRSRKETKTCTVNAVCSKKLADTGKVTEELKRELQTIKQQYEETDATKKIAEFQETLPYIERMNEIRKVVLESQKKENQGRLER